MLYQKVLKPPSQTVNTINSFINNSLSSKQFVLRKHVAVNTAFVGMLLHSDNLQNNFATYNGMHLKLPSHSFTEFASLADVNHFDDLSSVKTRLKLPAFNIPDEIGVKFSNETPITIADKNVIGNILYRLTGEDGAPDTIAMQLILDDVESPLPELEVITQNVADEISIVEDIHETEAEQLEIDDSCETDQAHSESVYVENNFDAELTTQAATFDVDENEKSQEDNFEDIFSSAVEDISIDTQNSVENDLTDVVNERETEIVDNEDQLTDIELEDPEFEEDPDTMLEQDEFVADNDVEQREELVTESATQSFAELMDKWSIFSTTRSRAEDNDCDANNEVENVIKNPNDDTADVDMTQSDVQSDHSLEEISSETQASLIRKMI